MFRRGLGNIPPGTGIYRDVWPPAAVQDQEADAALGAIKGTGGFWYLPRALDALMFSLAVAVIKELAVIFGAHREIQSLSRAAEQTECRRGVQRGAQIKRRAGAVAQSKTTIISAPKKDRRVRVVARYRVASAVSAVAGCHGV
jgi:hypothetical protein